MKLKQQKSVKHLNGYTLLEMTLVLAVIAVIATFAIKMYHDATESNRVNKASLEIQHVLEAALAYNAAKGYWPVDNNFGSATPDCSTVTDTTFLNTYLPNQTNLSTYGAYICWSGANNGTAVAPALPPNYPRFWASIKLPGTYMTIAQQIAGMLPNAVATSDKPVAFIATGTPVSLANTPCNTSNPCYVRVEVPLPGAVQNSLFIKGMGYCLPHDPRDHTINTSTDCAPNNVCHFAAQAGIPTSVSCWQETWINSDAPGNTTNTDANQRLYYDVYFTCPGNFKPQLLVSPNFLTMPRFDATNVGNTPTGGMYDYPVYQSGLDRWTFGAPFPAPNNLYGFPVKVACSTGVCQFHMMATIGGRATTTGPPVAGQLITHYGSGPKPAGDGWPQYPGAIGASYIALCTP